MEQRHCHRDGGDDDAGNAREPVGGALLLLDEFLGLAQRLLGDGALRDQSGIGNSGLFGLLLRLRHRLGVLGHSALVPTPVMPGRDASTRSRP